MPCTSVFDAQDESYRERVLPRAVERACRHRSGRAGDVVALRRAARRGRRHDRVRRVRRRQGSVQAFRLHRRECGRSRRSGCSELTEVTRMPIKVGINGYGRIGRNILRALYEANRQKEIQIVALNDLGDAQTNAYLTRYDTRARQVPRRGAGRRRFAGRQRRSHQGARRARSGEAAVGPARRRLRVRVHRAVHQQGQGRRAPDAAARRRS